MESSTGHSRHSPPSPRRSLPRGAAATGALLSALAVVYASSLLTASLAAVAFFVFYRHLDLPGTGIGSPSLAANAESAANGSSDQRAA